jgi:histone-lysine N-methyltransferase EZH2
MFKPFPWLCTGWGCFIGEDVEKGEFIAEYVGELISQEEVERRARIYDRVKTSYIFSLNEDYAVDAARWEYGQSWP